MCWTQAAGKARPSGTFAKGLRPTYSYDRVHYEDQYNDINAAFCMRNQRKDEIFRAGSGKALCAG